MLWPYDKNTSKFSRRGKVVLALEGGYNLNSISASGAACVRALLGEKLSALEMEGTVDCASVRIIDDCRHIHEHYLLKAMITTLLKSYMQ